MICKIGWEFLSSDKTENPSEETNDEKDLKHISLEDIQLFYPITFPITTGAGTLRFYLL
jgi:multiple antibiotic resistance protein